MLNITKSILLGSMLVSMKLCLVSQTSVHYISKDLLNTWANVQYEMLILETTQALQNGKLLPIGINKDSAIKLIRYYYKDFDAYISVGIINVPGNTNNHQKDSLPPIIQKHGNVIEFKSGNYRASFKLKESEWKKFIQSSFTRTIFWNFYYKNTSLNRDSIKKITNELYHSLSVHLISDINNGRSVYKDPDTYEPIDSSAVLPLKTEIIQFIQSDPEDPSVGYDSMYSTDMLKWLDKEGNSIEILVVLNTQNLRTKIQSIGIKYNTCYIKYNDILLSYEMEKKLLRYLISYRLKS